MTHRSSKDERTDGEINLSLPADAAPTPGHKSNEHTLSTLVRVHTSAIEGSQHSSTYTHNADILMHRNTPNLPLYNVDTHKHPEVNPNFPPVRAGTLNIRQVNSQCYRGSWVAW